MAPTSAGNGAPPKVQPQGPAAQEDTLKAINDRIADLEDEKMQDAADGAEDAAQAREDFTNMMRDLATEYAVVSGTLDSDAEAGFDGSESESELGPPPSALPAAKARELVNGMDSSRGTSPAPASVKGKTTQKAVNGVNGTAPPPSPAEMARMADDAVSRAISAIEAKYVQMYQDLKRADREYARERRRLTKERDAARAELAKAQSARTKLESLARELQRDNRRLKDDARRSEPLPQLPPPSQPLSSSAPPPSSAQQSPQPQPDPSPQLLPHPVPHPPPHPTTHLHPTAAPTPPDQAVLAKSLEDRLRNLEGLVEQQQLLQQQYKSARLERTMYAGVVLKQKRVDTAGGAEGGEAKVDGVVLEDAVRETLKDVFEQYALRERYLDCVLKAKTVQLRLAEGKALEWEHAAKDNASKVSNLEAKVGGIQKKLVGVESMINDRVKGILGDEGARSTGGGGGKKKKGGGGKAHSHGAG